MLDHARCFRSVVTLVPAAAVIALSGLADAGSVAGITDHWTLTDGRGVRLLAGDDGITEYSIERSDGTWTADRVLDPRLRLRWGDIDPLAAVAAAAAGDPGGPDDLEVPTALQQPAGARLRVIQCTTQWLDDYRVQLEALGVEVHQHLPATARIVRMDDAQAAAVAALPFVRWTGPYEPAWRADGRLLETFDGATFRMGPQRMVVRLVDPAVDRPGLAAAVAALGGSVDQLAAGKLIAHVTVDGDQLRALLALDEVLSVDPWSPYETDMAIAREIGGAAELETVAGYDGSGVRGEVMDNGFNLGHVDFASRPLIVHGNVSASSHGASTSGIVFGDGTGDASARGLLPAGQGIVADYDDVGVSGPNRYDHTGELVTPAYEAVFQSCSFGSARTLDYTNISAEMDAIIFDFDLSVCQSQSNSGNQLSRPQAWAKNIISVGGVRHLDTLTKSDDSWSGASIGPASDGRIKPDLTHFNEFIETTTCCGPSSYTSGFGGTSGATPIVAGYLGLVYDMWNDGIFGNEVTPGGTVFANRSRQSTAKAMLINSARPYEWTSGGPNGNLDRARQGWGMPSAIDLHDRRERTLVIDETIVLSNLLSHSETFTVLPGEPDVRVTLTWADPPGTTSASVHRINDLDLVVTAPNGTVYRGNAGLDAGLWSTPGGIADDINTVENVFVANPVAGTWTIEVIAAELNQDGHLETPGLDADFALVARGGVGVPPPLLVSVVSPIPGLLPPGTPFDVTVRLDDFEETLDPATAVLAWRVGDDVAFSETPLLPLNGSDDLYVATLPSSGCASASFYVAAASTKGTVVTSPANAPDVTFGVGYGVIETVADLDMELDGGWTVSGSAPSGTWERGVPLTGSFPFEDGDGSGSCWQTAIAGGEDVDGGSTILISPAYDITSFDGATLEFLRYFLRFGGDGASLVTEVTTDGGATWTEVNRIATLAANWETIEVPLGGLPVPTGAVHVRFVATDDGPDSSVEAGIDGLRLVAGTCTDPNPADVDGDGIVGFSDLLDVLAAWGACPGGGEPCPADVDLSGAVGFDDLLAVLAAWS